MARRSASSTPTSFLPAQPRHPEAQAKAILVEAFLTGGGGRRGPTNTSATRCAAAVAGWWERQGIAGIEGA
jgi:hypothetical protein